MSNWTERLRKVMDISEEEAKLAHPGIVGTEDVLFGILMEGENVAAVALRHMGVDLERALQEVKKITGKEPEPKKCTSCGRGLPHE